MSGAGRMGGANRPTALQSRIFGHSAHSQGQVGVGAVAAATAMALRLSGMSHWVMWEFASLFEQVGTVQDGINTLATPPSIVDRQVAIPLQVSRAEVGTQRYGACHGEPPMLTSLNHIAPASGNPPS